MSSASDIFREVLALGDRVRGLGQRVNNLGARVDASSADRFANKYSVSIKNGKSTKSVSVSGYKLEERDALREAEAKNPGWSAVSVARLDDACADADKKPAEGGKYNASAVQKEIEKDKRIKPGEAKLIHGLLKGWRKDDADAKADWDAYPSYTLAELKSWLNDPKVPDATKEKARTEIAARESGKSKQKKTPQVGW